MFLKYFLRIIIIFTSILIFIIIILAIGYPKYKRYKAFKNKENLTETIKENKDILDTLVEKLYSQDAIIVITYKEEKIIFKENGEERTIDQDFKDVLLSLFNNLPCKSIILYKENFVKVLELFMGANFVVDGDTSLIYREKKGNDLQEEILPNWYYRMLYHI